MLSFCSDVYCVECSDCSSTLGFQGDPSFVPVITINYQMGAVLAGSHDESERRRDVLITFHFVRGPLRREAL